MTAFPNRACSRYSGAEASCPPGIHNRNRSVSLNLSEESHLFQISKTGTIVSLFVDDAEVPCLEIDYSLFPAIAGTQIDLFQTSNPGIVQAFVDGFSFTSTDVHSVPEPCTNGLILPGFLSPFAVSFVTEKRKRME